MVKAPSGVDPDPVRKKTLDPDLGSMGKKKKLDPDTSSEKKKPKVNSD